MRLGIGSRLRPLGVLLLLVALSACEGAGLPIVTAPSAAPAASSATPSVQASPAVSTQPTNPPQPTTPASAPAQSLAAAAGAPSTQPVPAAGELATLESLALTPLPRRDAVALAFQFGRAADEQRIAREQPLDVQVGDIESFWISNLEDESNYQIEATLVLALEHALVYVENGVEVDLQALERDARTFNDRIYPRTRELFGSEWTPGIDGDPRLTILNARIPGAGGYFSSSDEVPRSTNRYSNERELFYINVDSFPPGSQSYLSTLAHEFQHMIQYNVAERPATWLNEGLSQLAEELNGFADTAQGVAPAYLNQPDLQLTAWGSNPSDSLPHYAASYLFLTYLYQQYGAQLDLQRVIEQNAGERLDVFADLARAQNAAIADFGDLYADWATANLLNAPDVGAGRYAYAQLPATVQAPPLEASQDHSVAQFGSDYWQIAPSRQERVVRFDGSDTIGVVSAAPRGTAMWWSNRGDNGSGTLDRRVDLRGVDAATLSFSVWHDIEAGWDYGYVAVSTDSGQTWTTLEGQHTTTEDPQGLSQGNGYTGISGGGDTPSWVEESIDLSQYAGSEIVLRFAHITDDASNRPGMVIDDLRIPEIEFSDDVDGSADGWEARGFVRTGNSFPQLWELRFVRRAGTSVTVETLALDQQNRSELRLAPGESGTLIVMAATPYTTERATYGMEN